MLWVKNGDKTFLITSFNIHFNNATNLYELWATKLDGKGVMLVSFEEKYVKEYHDMFTFAVTNGERYLEV
jgi:hypothetical protein